MKAVCYLQLHPLKTGGTITGVKVGRVTQNRPTDLFANAVPVKVALDIPLSIFDSLVAEVTVSLPEGEPVRAEVSQGMPEPVTE